MKEKIPKDFILKKLIQETAWHRNKKGEFVSLDKDLKNSDVFYKQSIIQSNVKDMKISVGELRRIIEAHAHILKNLTNGWYEKN